MTEQTGRIVSAEEAQRDFDTLSPNNRAMLNYAHTVATEPDRTRAAVVKALRHAKETCWSDADAEQIEEQINAVENGAPL